MHKTRRNLPHEPLLCWRKNGMRLHLLPFPDSARIVHCAFKKNFLLIRFGDADSATFKAM